MVGSKYSHPCIKKCNISNHAGSLEINKEEEQVLQQDFLNKVLFDQERGLMCVFFEAHPSSTTFQLLFALSGSSGRPEMPIIPQSSGNSPSVIATGYPC